jgi:cellobiose phosphorylase
MNAVYARLVHPRAALIQPLDPPFDTSDLDPGYICRYVAGVRENGGHYTHGAIWTAMAFAALGDHARASLMGLELEVDRLRFSPRLPPEWYEFSLRYRYRETYCHIAIRRIEMEGNGELDEVGVTVDGVAQDGNFVLLADDRQEHRVEVRVASPVSGSANEPRLILLCHVRG